MTHANVIIKGLDASITIDPGRETNYAFGILFDEEGNTVAETEGTRYSGFCAWEILYSQANRLFDHRRQIEPEDVVNAIDALGFECRCDDEEDGQ